MANLGLATQCPEEANDVAILNSGKAVNVMASAIKHPGEGPVVSSLINRRSRIINAGVIRATVPYGHPATLGGVEVVAVAVLGIQGDGAVTGPGPGAAAIVGVKAEIVHQLIAIAARLWAAGSVGQGIGTHLVAAAGQVMPDIVEFLQGGDLDEAIAVGISPPHHDGEVNRMAAGGIGGGHLVGQLAAGAGQRAGDHAAVIAGRAGYRQAAGQGRAGRAVGQVSAPIVDKHYGLGIDPGCQAEADGHQPGRGQGAQVQFRHPPQAAVAGLHDNEGKIAGVGRKTRQADGDAGARGQALAAGGDHAG